MTTGSLLPDVRIGVVIPAGPKDDVADTLQSALYHLGSSRHVVIVDDTRGSLDLPYDTDVTVVEAPTGATGGQGGLWVKIAFGYRTLLQQFRPGVVLRLDADALVIGRGLEDAAERAFCDNPTAGLLGACRIGPDGNRRDFTHAAKILAVETGVLGLRHPALRSLLRNWLDAAGDGYEPGEHALGGAYVHRGVAAMEMLDAGLLDVPVLAQSGLGEDHLMALATFVAGFTIADLGGPGQPMAVKWRGLPDSPEHLLACGALVTHSVRFWNDMDEPAVRSAFRAART